MSDLKIIGAYKKTYTVNKIDNEGGIFNEFEFDWDVKKINNQTYHIIKDDKSYNLEVLKIDTEEKIFTIKVNGKKHKLTLQDKFDILLAQLGMDDLLTKSIIDLKAPMPGLVLEVSVKGGQQVGRGEPLVILEAMKMENVIKSPTDGVIKDIAVIKGDTIEKNQLILNFE